MQRHRDELTLITEVGMVARIWHGRTRARDYDAYWAFLRDRAIPDYRSTPGNRGVRFAGADIAVAKYYPEGREYLLEFEPSVQHYEVTDGEALGVM